MSMQVFMLNFWRSAVFILLCKQSLFYFYRKIPTNFLFYALATYLQSSGIQPQTASIASFSPSEFLNWIALTTRKPILPSLALEINMTFSSIQPQTWTYFNGNFWLSFNCWRLSGSGLESYCEMRVHLARDCRQRFVCQYAADAAVQVSRPMNPIYTIFFDLPSMTYLILTTINYNPVRTQPQNKSSLSHFITNPQALPVLLDRSQNAIRIRYQKTELIAEIFCLVVVEVVLVLFCVEAFEFYSRAGFLFWLAWGFGGLWELFFCFAGLGFGAVSQIPNLKLILIPTPLLFVPSHAHLNILQHLLSLSQHPPLALALTLSLIVHSLNIIHIPHTGAKSVLFQDLIEQPMEGSGELILSGIDLVELVGYCAVDSEEGFDDCLAEFIRVQGFDYFILPILQIIPQQRLNPHPNRVPSPTINHSNLRPQNRHLLNPQSNPPQPLPDNALQRLTAHYTIKLCMHGYGQGQGRGHGQMAAFYSGLLAAEVVVQAVWGGYQDGGGAGGGGGFVEEVQGCQLGACLHACVIIRQEQKLDNYSIQYINQLSPALLLQAVPISPFSPSLSFFGVSALSTLSDPFLLTSPFPFPLPFPLTMVCSLLINTFCSFKISYFFNERY